MKLEIHNMAGHLIRRLNQISMSIFNERMRVTGHALTSVQFAAMNALHANPGLDQASLAGLIAYDRATIGGVVDRLEGKGLVKRIVNERDRRARTITLTPEGEQILQELIPVVKRFQDEILLGLDEGERVEFLRLAAKVADAGNHLSRAPLILDRKP
ncbi:MarR family transcriptional regulator [Celeribacter baekdonensis]|uniref:MarR family winged helix-turn-helix transcriptional regulator n=1 Tax=Celeribacter baekdonensis TaxID=875171 RepID=UPI0030DB29A0|tara:strand:+ start:81475 stop:81945 length:471 start_codon:yes stop_codon:yes gene_type:complete